MYNMKDELMNWNLLNKNNVYDRKDNIKSRNENNPEELENLKEVHYKQIIGYQEKGKAGRMVRYETM